MVGVEPTFPLYSLMIIFLRFYDHKYPFDCDNLGIEFLDCSDDCSSVFRQRGLHEELMYNHSIPLLDHKIDKFYYLYFLSILSVWGWEFSCSPHLAIEIKYPFAYLYCDVFGNSIFF